MSNAERIAELTAQRDAINEEIKQLVAEDAKPVIPEFDSWDDVVWPDMTDTGEPDFHKGTWHKWPHVKVAGAEYRLKIASAGVYDYVAIAELGVRDVTANPWILPAQHRLQWGSATEDERAIMLQRMRDYSGGLRDGLHPCPDQFLEAYLETHPEPKGPTKRVPQPIAAP